MHLYLWRFLFCLSVLRTNVKSDTVSFPGRSDFLIGSATSAYQIEGAWNVSGKGENIWDRLTHDHPGLVEDHSNGDVACDSYHKFKEDVQLLKNLGVDFYRFSLSWSRILPAGRSYKVNPDGIRYYNDLINELLANGISPMITLFHWDTPQPLQDLGGFTNDLIIDWFVEYAQIVFENFADRVKLWVTFNEPKQTCLGGYGLKMAPNIYSPGIGAYICTHNLIKAHARVWHLFDKKYRKINSGKMGVTLDAFWVEPTSNSSQDVAASERLIEFTLAWFSDPIFGKNGDYPKVMKDDIGKRSKLEGFKESRLPKFTPKEIQYIKGTYDFFGLNHYSSLLGQDAPSAPIGDPSYAKDFHATFCGDRYWPKAASIWLMVVPCGFEKTLLWIHKRYKHDRNLKIYVTESGYSDFGELNDTKRIDYYTKYLVALKRATVQGVKIKAYTAWSLLDNFEWLSGYTVRFGLYHVDFEDPDRKRTPKASVQFFKDLIETRKLEVDSGWDVKGVCTIDTHGKICPPGLPFIGKPGGT